MVVNLSYKFTHLAQSFRPHHHFNTLRNAFPSTHPAGFDFTSNVFGSVSNAASNAGSGATTTTLGVAAGALGAGAGAAAGAGSGGAAGGAGGASSKAGSWASHWGFQVRCLLHCQATTALTQVIPTGQVALARPGPTGRLAARRRRRPAFDRACPPPHLPPLDLIAASCAPCTPRCARAPELAFAARAGRSAPGG